MAALFYTNHSMSPGRQRMALAAGAAAAMIVGAVLGLTDPHGVVGSTGWSVAVMGVLWGFGAEVERRLQLPFGSGQRMLVGSAIWILLTGILVAIGVASRGPLLVIAAVGFVLALFDLARRSVAMVDGPASRPTIEPAYLVLGAALAVYLIANLVGVVASLGNPYDDHVGYTAFVKRVLDSGDLIEPFSYRRISAYGGQTMLHALVALRGDVESTDLLDRGIFQIITFLLVLDLARARRLHPGIITLIIVFLACLWDLSINSASTWTGLACFISAYSFASDEDRPSREGLVLTFVICAVACTLRQNYLLPAGLFAALLLVFHVRSRATGSTWRLAITQERITIVMAIASAFIVLLPYMVATWRSNNTFLYPLLLGNANPSAPLRPSGATFTDELSFLVSVSLGSEPIRIWWILVPFMFLARDARARRPWYALLIASLIGFGFMVHSFMLSDVTTLWRYGFAYMTALAIIFLIEALGKVPFVADNDPRPGPLRVSPIVVFCVWLAVLTQFVQGRAVPEKRVNQLMKSLKVAMTYGTERTSDYELYQDLQRSFPEGARVGFMLDNPFLLDYARNDLVNIDLPGFVAPPPGLPSFLGPERWRSYLASQGIRYIAFTTGQSSTYLYQRSDWLARLFTDGELWRFMSAHMIDTHDTLAELARTSRVLFHREGLIAFDLGEQVPPVSASATNDEPEIVRQDRFARRISETELGDKTWELSSRRDVIFQPDGYGPSTVQLEIPDRPNEFTGGLMKHLYGDGWRQPPYRWVTDRTHVRVFGTGSHVLRVKLHASVYRLGAIPTATVRVDGQRVGRVRADKDGNMEIESTVSCTGWCDVYIVLSTMSEFWLSADNLRALKLLEFGWTE